MCKEKILIDCDPGSDDAIAIILALLSEELDLKAVTSVTGNGNIDNTTRNAKNIVNLCGRKDIPVYRGSDKALDSDAAPDTVEAFGDDGLGGFADTIDSDKTIEKENAVDFLVDYVNSHKNEITLFALGPCTNIAKAIRKSKDFSKNLKRIIIMGGAKYTGNCSPVAEYNFWADSLAAKEVLKSDIKEKVVIGLDVTNKIALTCENREIFRLYDTEITRFIYNITKEPLDDNWKNRRKLLSPMHDVLTIAYFLKPEILEIKDAYIDVVTEGIAKGQSVVDIDGHWSKGITNAKFAIDVDCEKFYKLLLNRIVK